MRRDPRRLTPAPRRPRVAAMTVFAALALARVASAAAEKADSLFDAIRAHDVKTVTTMVSRDTSLLRSRVKVIHWSPLHVAVIARDTTIVGFLIRKGANLQATDDYGSSPLHFSICVAEDSTRALRARCRTIQRQLLAAGAKVNMPDRNGATALHWAASKGDSALVVSLIHEGADVNAVAVVGGWTPLLGAVAKGNRGIVRTLAQYGARLDMRDAKGRTALMMANESREDAMAGLLRKLGAKE